MSSMTSQMILFALRSRKWKTIDVEDQEKNLDREDGEFW